jgi:hypothetical protein
MLRLSMLVMASMILHGAVGFRAWFCFSAGRSVSRGSGLSLRRGLPGFSRVKSVRRPQLLRARADAGEWEDISGDGGCLKQVVTAVPSGDDVARPRKGCIATLHYEMSINGQVLDSSRAPDREVFEFELGLDPSDAIKGWEVAILTMCEGEVARLRCAPEYAFGAAGSPPKIPANATIDCTLELLSWVDKTSKWSALADQYTSSEVPEEEVYEKYKNDIQTGDQKGMANDFGVSQKRPDGKEREVYALDDIRLQKMAQRNQRIGGKFKNYRWSETERQMDLFVSLPEGTTAKDMDVEIKRDKLRVAVKGQAPLLQGELSGCVRASECWWVVTEEGSEMLVHAQLAKLPPYDKLWASVVKGD